MGEYFVGEIRAFAINFAPTGWLKCEGQELPINSYAALYSLIGIYFGGNGTSTFKLPDLRGRVIQQMGNYDSKSKLGYYGGAESVALAAANAPSHMHTINGQNPPPVPLPATLAVGCSSLLSDAPSPVGNIVGGLSGMANKRYNSLTPDSEMKPGVVTVSGTTGQAGGAAHPNMAPYLPLTYCIAINGIYPSRS
jgi:microcystin-dependent protein